MLRWLALKFEISYKLQDIEYQIDRLVAYRKALVMQMSEKVRELPRDNFAVRQHLKYVDLYSSEENYNALTYEDTLIVKEEVAPLILSDGDEASAVRFDALMYGIELAYLAGKKYSRARSDLHKKIAGIASVANIPEIQAQTDLINKVLNTDYVDTAGINEFEEIREKLRNLMKYLPNSSIRYDTNFTDEVLSTEWNESELENDDLKNYLIGMEQWNIRNINRIIRKDPEHKVHLLLEYTGEARDIADPWYTGNFDVTYDDVKEGCEAFLQYLMENEPLY